MELIEVGVAAKAMQGERTSADRYLVRRFPGRVLLAVVDGLGHGEEAAEAAESAVRLLGTCPESPLTALLTACHERLRRTRGAVMSLASIDESTSTLCWVGVGNIAGMFLGRGSGSAPQRKLLMLRSGIVGIRIPTLSPQRLILNRNEVVAFATDGVSPECFDELTMDQPPQWAADRILRRYCKDRDDALVLVARYLGGTLG